jgi:Rod binding domain-containing protein
MHIQPPRFQPLFETHRSTVNDYQVQKTKEGELREAAKGFEAILVTMMFKKGMQNARDISETEDESANQFMDMAYEQIAEHISKNVNMGLSDSIYENLKNRL